MAEDNKPGAASVLIKTASTDPNAAYAAATLGRIKEELAKPDSAAKLKLSPAEIGKLRASLDRTARDKADPADMTPAEKLAAAAKDGGKAAITFRDGSVAAKQVYVSVNAGNGKTFITHDGGRLDMTVPSMTAPVAAPSASAAASAAAVRPVVAPAPAPAPAAPAASAAAKPPGRSGSGVVTGSAEQAASAAAAAELAERIKREDRQRINEEARKAEATMLRYPPAPPPSDRPAAAVPAAPPAAAKPPKPGKKPTASTGGKFDPQVAATENFLIALGHLMAKDEANSPRWHFHRLVKGIDGERDRDLTQALEVFQDLNGIPKTGKIDKDTIVKMQGIMRDAGISDVGMPPLVSVDGKVTTMDRQTIRSMASFATLTQHADKIRAAQLSGPIAADAEHARVQGILDSGGAGIQVGAAPAAPAAPAAAAAPGAVDVDGVPAASGADTGVTLEGLRRGAAGLAESAGNAAQRIGAGAQSVLGDLRQGAGNLLQTGRERAAEIAADLERRRLAETGGAPAATEGERPATAAGQPPRKQPGTSVEP